MRGLCEKLLGSQSRSGLRISTPSKGFDPYHSKGLRGQTLTGTLKFDYMPYRKSRKAATSAGAGTGPVGGLVDFHCLPLPCSKDPVFVCRHIELLRQISVLY